MLEMVRILLIEDNPADVELVREAISEAKLMVDLKLAMQGRDALKQLETERPDLILLDLNLPDIDGRDVLRIIKGDPRLQAIPVVVLTTSDSDVDVIRAYGLGANSYLTKPVGFERFMQVIGAIEQFWLTMVKLPSRELVEQHSKGP